MYYYVNDNGAIIEIVEVKTNTFEEGLYRCCTVDIDINIYNDDFSVKVPFTLKNVDSGITCFDWYGDYLEDMYESVVGFNEDKDGNYIGDEEDRAFYEAAAYVGDDFLYGATLFEGEFHIKGIRKSTKEKMCRRVVDCLCQWAQDNAEEYDFEMHNFVNVNEGDLEFGKEYPCGLQKPIVEVE